MAALSATHGQDADEDEDEDEYIPLKRLKSPNTKTNSDGSDEDIPLQRLKKPKTLEEPGTSAEDREECKASDFDILRITNELTPDELQRLFHNLDIPQRDIEHAEMSTNTNDTQLKARAVFLRWRETKGRRATRKALLEARSKIYGNDKEYQASDSDFLRVTNKDSPPKDEFDVTTCQRELRNFYLRNYCKIPQFPGDKRNYLNMDDIYTDLSILINSPKPAEPTKIPHHEIFKYKADNGIPASRMLVLGHPGCGKTSLMLKLAHDWAVQKSDSPLKDIPLLFALNMRWMTPETTLEDAIFQQLLPKYTELSKSSLRLYIKTHQKDCILLFDAYDEYGFNDKNFQEKVSRVHDILFDNYLHDCKVLVTSRFWKASDFNHFHRLYTQMEITGFSEEDVRGYVMRFFEQDKPSGLKLIEYLRKCNLNPGIANIPLMTLLFCFCWKESNGQNMPSKIGLLYDRVIILLKNQYIARSHNDTTGIDLPELIRNFGKVVFDTMFCTDDRLVFNLKTFVDNTPPDTVTDGFKIGLISVENESVEFLESLEENFDFNGQKPSDSKSSVVFFHKSCQEKCAGAYFAHICEEDLAAFTSSLHKINSVRTCLRLEMIIRFACGASSKAAYLILQQLLLVFRTELSTHIQRYYDETLEPDVVQQFQRLVELCLHCYFEWPDRPEAYNSILGELFPTGKMLFVGMSPYASSAIGLYLSLTRSIKSISVKAIHSSTSAIPHGVINKIFTQTQNKLKGLPPQQLQEKMQLTGTKNFYDLCQVWVVNYFKEWQQSFDVNLVPIINSLSSCEQLETLCLTNIKIGDQMTTLQISISCDGLKYLNYLVLHNCGLGSEQVNNLLASIPNQLPTLFRLDISNNKSRLTKLGWCLVASHIKRIHVHKMEAPAEDMALLVDKLPQFGPRMKTLQIAGNNIDEKIGHKLASVLPLASELDTCSISMNMLQNTTHNKVIDKMHHLNKLTILWILDSPYVNDLLRHISKTMKWLEHLHTLALSVCHQRTSAQQSRLTWPPVSRLSSRRQPSTRDTSYVKRKVSKTFIDSLGDMKQMEKLYLDNISIHPEYLPELLDLCEQRNYKEFRYSKRLFPEDIDDSQYGFLEFH